MLGICHRYPVPELYVAHTEYLGCFLICFGKVKSYTVTTLKLSLFGQRRTVVKIFWISFFKIFFFVSVKVACVQMHYNCSVMDKDSSRKQHVTNSITVGNYKFIVLKLLRYKSCKLRRHFSLTIRYSEECCAKQDNLYCCYVNRFSLQLITLL